MAAVNVEKPRLSSIERLPLRTKPNPALLRPVPLGMRFCHSALRGVSVYQPFQSALTAKVIPSVGLCATTVTLVDSNPGSVSKLSCATTTKLIINKAQTIIKTTANNEKRLRGIDFVSTVCFKCDVCHHVNGGDYNMRRLRHVNSSDSGRRANVRWAKLDTD